jgi:hypothetical protein
MITRKEVLQCRSNFLKTNPQAFKGNTVARKKYLEYLQINSYQLNDWQVDALVGLILSDGSIQVGGRINEFRLKINQSKKHIELLNNTFSIFQELTGSDDVIKESRNRKDMFEMQTLTCSLLGQFAYLFCSTEPIANSTLKRDITPFIKPFITPVSTAYWFCADGGKTDYTPNSGKGITFNTQSFSKQGCQILADALCENMGFDAFVVPDHKNSLQFEVRIGPKSYEEFIRQIGPYILPTLSEKLPKPRSDESRFGYGNQVYFDSHVSQAFKFQNYMEKYKR